MRQKLFFLSLLIICIVLFSCKTTRYTRNVTYVQGNAETITLRTTGYGATMEMAINDAEKYGIEQLLFRGIANSQQKVPIITLNESDAKKQYSSYFRDFFDNNRYKTFIVSSVPVSSAIRVKGAGVKTISIDVTVHISSLRTDLEHNNIVRQFGY